MCNEIVGVNGDEGTPVPIPNTVVKLVYGDNTWLATAREDNSTPTSKQQRKLLLFLLRVDTYGFYPLSSHFPLLLSLAQTRNQRSLRKGERQRIFSTVGEHSVLPFLDLFAVSDSLLLHMRLSLRRRNIPVSRELFTGAGGWGLSGKAHAWT